MNKKVVFARAVAVGITVGLISNYKVDFTVIIGGILAIVGIILLIGRYLNNQDLKKGYCSSGPNIQKLEGDEEHNKQVQGMQKSNEDPVEPYR
ncbi:MAG: hypothetical protein WC680_03460 [Sulfuricurvum sp.]|jgi:hypothetical protein